MKSFTAKEFSRCPAKVYEAARRDGEAEIFHDRFEVPFRIYYDENMYNHDVLGNRNPPEYEVTNGLELARQAYQANKKAIDTSALTGSCGVDAHLQARKVFFGEEKAPD